MSEVTTRPATSATKAPTRPKAAPSAAPTKPQPSEADRLALQAAAIAATLVQTVAEGRHGSSFAGFDEVVEADSIFLTLAQWNDPDGHERFEHDTIHGLLAQASVSIAQALSKVLGAEDCHAGERLERAVLLEAAHDRLTLLTSAIDGLPGTLEGLRVLTTLAGARQFRDRPSPPIRRVEEESDVTGPSALTRKQLLCVLEVAASNLATIDNILMQAQTETESFALSGLVDAAQALTRHCGGMVDTAAGAAILGGHDRWNFGPNFADLGMGGAA